MGLKALLLSIMLAMSVLIVFNCSKTYNLPPSMYRLGGPSSGKVDTSYTFSSSATDPDEDNVAIRFSWGDGDTSSWSSYVPCCSTIEMSDKWSSPDTYYVRTQAKDIHNETSNWFSPAFQFVIPVIGGQGTLKWSYTIGGTVESSPAIGSDGTIYVGSYYLFAINPDGTLKWSFTTAGPVNSSPAIGSDGTIYVGSDDTGLYAINPDGTLKWSFTLGYYYIPYAYFTSSPAIGSDGTIYVGSTHQILYAIYGSGSLANTTWPMFHHDLKHTGRK